MCVVCRLSCVPRETNAPRTGVQVRGAYNEQQQQIQYDVRIHQPGTSFSRCLCYGSLLLTLCPRTSLDVTALIHIGQVSSAHHRNGTLATTNGASATASSS